MQQLVHTKISNVIIVAKLVTWHVHTDQVTVYHRDQGRNLGKNLELHTHLVETDTEKTSQSSDDDFFEVGIHSVAGVPDTKSL